MIGEWLCVLQSQHTIQHIARATMMVRHVSKQEKIMNHHGSGVFSTKHNSQTTSSNLSRERSYSCAVLYKALAYSCSYFLTLDNDTLWGRDTSSL
eukprot:scaffold178751_cov53-Cyclotella_meneghiniana.AAC.1